MLLSNDEFVKKLKSSLDDTRSVKEVPKVQRFANRSDLQVLFGKRAAWSREEQHWLVSAAHLAHGYSLTEIAAAIDLHYTSGAKIVNAQSAKA